MKVKFSEQEFCAVYDVLREKLCYDEQHENYTMTNTHLRRVFNRMRSVAMTNSTVVRKMTFESWYKRQQEKIDLLSAKPASDEENQSE